MPLSKWSFGWPRYDSFDPWHVPNLGDFGFKVGNLLQMWFNRSVCFQVQSEMAILSLTMYPLWIGVENYKLKNLLKKKTKKKKREDNQPWNQAPQGGWWCLAPIKGKGENVNCYVQHKQFYFEPNLLLYQGRRHRTSLLKFWSRWISNKSIGDEDPPL